MHADPPPVNDSGDDAVERMLRMLLVATLPPDWRGTVLDSLPLPPLPVTSSTRFFTPKFVSLMAGIWGLTAVFHFTTPIPPPMPEGVPPSSIRQSPSCFPPDAMPGAPWLAQIENPSPSRQP